MTEAKTQRFLENNLRDILIACVKFQGPYTPKPKFRLSNLIEADLGVLDRSDRVVALFEVKGNVGINELVRGIGQTYQYQNHVDKKILYDYAPEARAFLVIPMDVYKKYDFQKLAFPKKSGIILINKSDNTFILLSKKRGSSGRLKKVRIISPYYMRDNRLGEIYLGLKMVEALSPRVMVGRVNMSKVRKKLKKIIKNKGNARNIPISLHGLGFLDDENRLTAEGQKHLRMPYGEFCKSLALNQISPFLNLIITALVSIATEKGNDLSKIITSPTEIRVKIVSLFDGSDVLYVTDSGTRYISSWLNILRDDLGAISFYPGNYKKGLKINYFPFRGYPFLMGKMPVAVNCRDDGYVKKGLRFIAKL